MHAYLIAGNDQNLVQAKVQEIAEKLDAKILPFELQKVADVRELLRFTKLKISQPTAIVIPDIDSATEEAQNAFLKNLEEPQQDLYYILTCKSTEAVLPTIASRCEVIELQDIESPSYAKASEGQAKDFLNAGVGEKLQIVSKINKREDAVEFINNLIVGGHKLLIDGESVAPFLEEAQKAQNNIKVNGNVILQLTNFVANLSSS